MGTFNHSQLQRKLILKSIDRLEDLVGNCFHLEFPELHKLYEGFCDGKVRYAYLSNLIAKEIDARS